MKNSKTQILIAIIGAIAVIAAAWISTCNSNKDDLPVENSGQMVSNDQNRVDKIENNQKKEITVQGDYVEGDKIAESSKSSYKKFASRRSPANDSTISSTIIQNNGINNGIMAKEVNVSLTPTQRTLTEELKKRFLSSPLAKRDTFYITYQMGDVEAQTFATQINDFFVSEGYLYPILGLAQLLEPVYGIKSSRYNGKPEIIIGHSK